MVLSDAQLWSLLLTVPALVSGVVAATVAFLLAKLRRDRVFRSFGWWALTLTAYGLADGVLSWATPDLTSWGYLGLGFVDVTLIGALIYRLGDLTADLIDRPWGPITRHLFLAPVMAAPVVVGIIVVTFPWWTFSSLRLVGSVFLLSVFLSALVCAIRLFVRWREVHDRVFRQILVGTGVLLVAFLPLWLADVFGHAGIYSFYWFLLCWNLASLWLASRAFFEPPSEPPQNVLFTAEKLDACARRFGLTAREAEIAGYHAQGYSAKDIGNRLFIAPKTVRNHISHLYEKTATGQRRELLALLRAGT